MITIKQYPMSDGQRFTMTFSIGTVVVSVETINGVSHLITQEPVNDGTLPTHERTFIVLREGNTYEPSGLVWCRAVFTLPGTSKIAVLLEEGVTGGVTVEQTTQRSLKDLLPLDAPQTFQKHVTAIAERHVKKPALAELVMGAMLQLGGQVTVLDVANLIVRDKQRVASELSALARQGKLRKIERGVYALPLGEVTAEIPQEVA